MMGRKPKPTVLRILEGNPGHRPLKREGLSGLGIPPCPKFLNVAAKREWRRVVPELDRMGLLAPIDRAALAGYCQSWARWMECESYIEEHGATMMFRDDKGNVKWTQAVPEVGIAMKYLDRLHKFASEFGLTPASRSRVNPVGPSADDAIEDALA